MHAHVTLPSAYDFHCYVPMLAPKPVRTKVPVDHKTLDDETYSWLTSLGCGVGLPKLTHFSCIITL